MSTAMAETKSNITVLFNSVTASRVVADYGVVLLVFLLCLLSFHSTTAASASGTAISAVHVGLTKDFTRITLESRKPIQYELSVLNNPGRVVIDLANIPLNDAIKSLPGKISPADPHIERIRYGRFQPHVIRVVLDLKANVVPRTSTAEPKNGQGYQLILDIYRPDKAAVVENDHRHHRKALPAVRETVNEADALDHLVAALIHHKPSAQPPVPPKPSRPQQQQSEQPPQAQPMRQTQQVQQPQQNHQPPQQVEQPTDDEPLRVARNYPESYAVAQLRKPAQSQSQSRTQKPVAQRIITIAIDPGHGGHDPGAIAKNGKGTKEKDITLAISRKLKSIIDKEPNMRAILTRNGDYYLNLNQRQAIARKHKADLFVSIHADGSEKVHPRGSSVYTLSEHGATSTTASWLAKQANQAGNHLIGGVDIASKSGDMREIILDLSMSATINDSVKLAELVLQEISRINQLHKKTVEQAGFVVLKSPDIPSILVETAFITNPHEEQKLIDKTYQNRMANAIFSGIRNYFATNPALSRTEMAQAR